MLVGFSSKEDLPSTTSIESNRRYLSKAAFTSCFLYIQIILAQSNSLDLAGKQSGDPSRAACSLFLLQHHHTNSTPRDSYLIPLVREIRYELRDKYTLHIFKSLALIETLQVDFDGFAKPNAHISKAWVTRQGPEGEICPESRPHINVPFLDVNQG